MHASVSRPSRRAVLAGTAAAAALTAVPVAPRRAHAAEDAADGTAAYRWRNVVIGGTGFITGVLFHPRVRGLAYARTDIGGAYRWDDRAARWTPLLDHIGWDDWNLLGVEAMAVDPPTRTGSTWPAAPIPRRGRATARSCAPRTGAGPGGAPTSP